MSSHVHLLISWKEKSLLEEIMRDMKKFTSFKLIEAIKENQQESQKEWLLEMFVRAGQTNSNNTKYQFWQQNNRPIELDSNLVIDQKLNYLHYNPVEAGYVSKEENYVYSSARDYADEKGLLDIVKIV